MSRRRRAAGTEMLALKCQHLATSAKLLALSTVWAQSPCLDSIMRPFKAAPRQSGAAPPRADPQTRALYLPLFCRSTGRAGKLASWRAHKPRVWPASNAQLRIPRRPNSHLASRPIRPSVRPALVLCCFAGQFRQLGHSRAPPQTTIIRLSGAPTLSSGTRAAWPEGSKSAARNWRRSPARVTRQLQPLGRLYDAPRLPSGLFCKRLARAQRQFRPPSKRTKLAFCSAPSSLVKLAKLVWPSALVSLQTNGVARVCFRSLANLDAQSRRAPSGRRS